MNLGRSQRKPGFCATVLAMAGLIAAAGVPLGNAAEPAPPAPPAPPAAQPAPQVPTAAAPAAPTAPAPAAPSATTPRAAAAPEGRAELAPERPKIRYWLDENANPPAETSPKPAAPGDSEGYPSPRDTMNDVLIEAPPPPPLKDITDANVAASERRAALKKEITSQLGDAKKAYGLGDYHRTIAIARNVLNADPGNVTAAEWLRKARGKLLDGDERVAQISSERRDREAMLETYEHAVRPPPRTPIERPRLTTRNDDTDIVRRQKILTHLEQRITVDFSKADLEFVLNTLFILTGVNIIADQAALEGKSVTLHVEDLPLREVLNFIVRNNEGIQYSITGDAVWITATEESDLKKLMYPKVYPLHYGLVSTTPNQGGQAAQRGGGNSRAGTTSRATGGSGGGGGGAGGQEEPTYIETVLKWLKEAKDAQSFPEGSDYLIDRQSNQLVVYTTPAGHQRIQEFLDYFDQPAMQCLIKARFLDIQATEDSALGLNLDSLNNNTTAGGHTSPFHLANLVGGAQQFVTSGTSGATFFTLIGSRTNPQFQISLAAMLADTRTKILSEPQILAINNKEAVIDVTTSFSYITDLQPIEGQTTPGNGTQLYSQTVVGYTPRFDQEKIGFTLIVTPSIGRDLRTITLHLSPVIDSLAQGEQVTDFQNFTPGTPNAQGTIIPPVIKRPTIDQTSLETDVVMEDNGYCIIGGLVRNRQEVDDRKIPGLWKIPGIGRFFQSTKTSIQKSNLMIIVEAQEIISTSGRTYFKEAVPDDANPREGGVNRAPGQTSDAARADFSQPGLAQRYSPGSSAPVRAAETPRMVRSAPAAAAPAAPDTGRRQMERLSQTNRHAPRATGWSVPEEEDVKAEVVPLGDPGRRQTAGELPPELAPADK